MAKNNMVATDISSDSSSTIAQQKLKKFWTRGFQEKMAHVLAMCISFKMVKYNIYIYTGNRGFQTFGEHPINRKLNIVELEPTQQIKAEFMIMFFLQTVKRSIRFFSIYGNLKKNTAPGFFMKRRGKSSSGIFLFLCFFPDGTWLRLCEAGACFGP